MPLIDTITRVKGRANDIKRRLLLPANFRIFLLKRGVETKRLVSIREITNGVYVRYSDYRQQLALENETLDTTFPDDIAQGSWFAAGIPIEDPDNVGTFLLDVYSIDPQRRDVVPPTVDSTAWKVYLTREPKERFILP